MLNVQCKVGGFKSNDINYWFKSQFQKKRETHSDEDDDLLSLLLEEVWGVLALNELNVCWNPELEEGVLSTSSNAK